MVEVVSSSPECTEHFGELLGGILKGGEVVACFGGLGMGKTRFTAGIAKGMGNNAEVSSPTFALVHEYGGKIPLCHFDMYRINGFEDLCTTGFFDYIDNGSVLVIEWSENIENVLPEDNLIRIDFERGDTDGTRVIKMSGDGVYENSWR